jgi:hypothetical protein
MANESNAKMCFVIMPFGAEGSQSRSEFDKVYTFVIKKAVEESGLGYHCIRADDVMKPNNIIKDIAHKIYNANVVIADLSNQNPNVFYELGVRHALVGRTIIIAQRMSDVPFDLQGLRTIIYNPNDLLSVDQAITRIRDFLRKIDAEPESSDNPIHDSFGGPPSPKRPPGVTDADVSILHEIANLKNYLENSSYTILEQFKQCLGREFEQLLPRLAFPALPDPAQSRLEFQQIPILASLNKSGIANIYERRAQANERILQLLPQAKEKVQLVGISLRRFFHHGNDFNDQLRHLSLPPVKWQALVLDPMSDQALYRSLREQETTYRNILQKEKLDYSHMEKEELFRAFFPVYRNMMLYTDVNQTKNNIQFAREELGIQIDLRFYRGAPACFLAIIDDFLLIEQYHYGASADERVAEQVPAFEFRRGSEMYNQMSGHYDHVWKHLSRPSFDEDVATLVRENCGEVNGRSLPLRKRA